MKSCLRAPKSLSLKILPLNPYNSEILMLTRRELHCFHTPGEGGTPIKARRSAVGRLA